MDITQDWCFFDKVWDHSLPSSTQSDYSLNLLSISEPSGWIFLADGKNLHLINSNSILDYPNSGPAKSIPFDLPITYLSCSQSGEFLGLAQSTDLFIFKTKDLIQGIKTPEITKFNSKIRVLEWCKDLLGVTTLEKKFEIWTFDKKVSEKDPVSYFTFINQNNLVLADEKKIGIYNLDRCEYKSFVEFDVKTIGLKFLRGIIFQFGISEESEPCLNLYDEDLQVISTIDFIECYPFAPQESLAKGGSDLDFVSFFYYIEQRDTILVSSTCSIYVDVLIKNSEYEKVNFEENLEGQCRSGWFEQKENTQRGFCMIKKYGNPASTFDFQVKDTLYTISQPPLILFIDSGGKLQLRRFVDLRNQYLNDILCEANQQEEEKSPSILQPALKPAEPGLQTPKKLENVGKSEDLQGSIFKSSFTQLKLSETTEQSSLKTNFLSSITPKPQESAPGLSSVPQTNPFIGLQQPLNNTDSNPTNLLANNPGINPFKNPASNEPPQSNPFALRNNNNSFKSPVPEPVIVEPGPRPVKPSEVLMRKLDSLMQSTLNSLKKSAGEVENIQIDSLISTNLHQNLERKCVYIAESYVKYTEKVRKLQEKTDDLEAMKEVIERNFFFLDSEDVEDENEIDFCDDISDWEKSLKVSEIYYKSALQPITKLYLDAIKQLTSSNGLENLSHVKKTRSFFDVKKLGAININEEKIKQVTQQSINDLKKSLKMLKYKMSNFNNAKKTSKVVYRFDVERSDEESEEELNFEYIDPREYKKLKFNKIT